jgi:uncharacterized membrane protein YjjP (DUF1212 family)
MSPLTGTARIISALAEFGYLTAHQITTLLYAPSSLAYVRKQLNALVAASLVLVLPRHSVTQPRLYTLSRKV